MLLTTLLKNHAGMEFTKRHSPDDFHPLSFEVGEMTTNGLQIIANPNRDLQRRNKGYRVVGLLR